ncbi:MAG TPA: response regulator transcription factor [Methanocellales archaeon]|nr:response regulator transcription factor [Methanocellales archaeon]
MDILVVEDERSLARMIEVELLMQHMNVEVCYNGKSALASAIEKKFDLVILDWMLPDIEGIEVCRILRSRGLQTPIIMITARQEVSFEVRGLTEGADDFIVKPFDIEQLVARIHAVMRRFHMQKEAISKIVFNSLVIDPATKAVYNHGQRIHITKKEFEILMLLLANRGKVVTKEEIYLSVWGKDVHIEDAAIAVHIKAIRDKVKGLKIENVRGFGYMIENSGQKISQENT